jgi:hypothetical protein
MKRALAVALALLAAFPVLAAAKGEKRQLIAELLEIIDAKALTQASFDAITNTMMTVSDGSSGSPQEIPEGYRAEWEASRKAQQEQLRAFRERLFARMDYVKYSEEAFVPLFDEHFTADELKELIAFFKTKPGQKLAKVIPDLGIGSVAKGQSLIMKAASDTASELEKEEDAKTPWKKTMSDLRTLAMALEARATDTNEYPNVSTEELAGLLSPTYIREVPKADSWGTPYSYVADGQHYRFASAGADRRFEWSSRQIDLSATEPHAAASADADIVFQDGQFTQFPAESKKEQR